MKRLTNPAQKTQNSSSARMRGIPSVDELLGRPRLLALAEKSGRKLVTQSARTVLANLRERLKKGAGGDSAADSAQLEMDVVAEVEAHLAPSLVRVINATGVILHTNLGRAPLSTEAAAHISETATRYSNLEYALETGRRGQRDIHTSRMLAGLAGAEAAIVVNNNAA
ncbi:MAG: hypothetical protein WCD43_01870, partial [Candidatus Acidiferrales bacterium]